MIKEDLFINIERLMHTINISGKIGALSEGGICRLALTDEDKQMRDVFVKWMKQIDLEVRIDDFGNIYGRKEGEDSDAPAILIGSHLDTQPEGGKYDGILGVLAALEVLTVFHEHDISFKHSIEIVNFTNEEGARFEPPLLGSGGLSEHFSKDFIYSRTDGENKTFGEELKRIGQQGNIENRAKNVGNYLELHIEQGPILEKKNLDIGVVTGIQGMNWMEVKIKGESNHAGPTPMSMRKDALLIAMKLIQKVTNMVAAFDKETTITVGKFKVYPNSINSIPGEVTFSIDVRHSEDNKKHYLTNIIVEKLTTMAKAENVSIEINEIWDAESIYFSEYLIQTISQNLEGLGYTSQKMVSGAGHDAKYMNKLTATSMLFVPSQDGKSHCQEEFTSKEEIEKGANALLHTVHKIAVEI